MRLNTPTMHAPDIVIPDHHALGLVPIAEFRFEVVTLADGELPELDLVADPD